MAAKPIPTQETLRQLFDYNPNTGAIHWRERDPTSFASGSLPHAKMWNKKFAGKIAGTRTKLGYFAININNVRFTAHRIIWKMVHGVDAKVVDHINGQGLDNRIANLRSVTQAENCRNSAVQLNNKTGYPGVWKEPKKGYWEASIKDNGKKVFIGNFETLADAVTARRFAERIYGYHANHGRSLEHHQPPPDR